MPLDVIEDFVSHEIPERSMTFKDQTVTMYRDDSYGLISVKFKNGRAPNTLSGQYTSYFEAEKAINLYFNSKDKT